MIRSTTPRRALSVDLFITTNEPELTAYLDVALGCLPETTNSPVELTLTRTGDGAYVVEGPAESTTTAPTASHALTLLISSMNRLVSGANTSELLLHAAGVQGPQGCVLFPAAPGAGKSTLAAGLVERGWDYLSDEVVAIDPATLQALPYPRPITLKPGSWPVMAHLRPVVPPELDRYLQERWLVPPQHIRTDPVARGGPVIGIVLPTYDSAVTSRLEPNARAETLQAVVKSSFNLGDHGRVGFHALGELVRGADCARLTSSDLDQVCADLCDRFWDG